MRQFLADAVQIFFGICELLRVTIDKMHPANQRLIFTTASGSPSAANAGTTKTASIKNTLAKME